MTEGSWDEYLGSGDSLEEDSTELSTLEQDLASADPSLADVDGADLASAEESLSAASGDVSDAGLSQDWASWDAATGDEAAQSAESYEQAGVTDIQEGWTETGEQELADAEAQAGVADDSYTSSDWQAADESSSLDAASSELDTASESLDTSYEDTSVDTSADTESE